MLTADQAALVAIRRLQGADSVQTLLLVIDDILRQYTGKQERIPEGLTVVPVVGRDGHVGVLRVESPRDTLLSRFPTNPGGSNVHFTKRFYRRNHAFVWDHTDLKVSLNTWSVDSIEAVRVHYWQEMKDETVPERYQVQNHGGKDPYG